MLRERLVFRICPPSARGCFTRELEHDHAALAAFITFDTLRTIIECEKRAAMLLQERKEARLSALG